MSLSIAQIDVLQTLATLTSLLSMAGSCTIIYNINSKRSSSSLLRLDTIESLVLTMSVLDIFSSLSFSFGTLPHSIGGPDSFVCQLQAFSIELFALSTVFWNACMAHNLYLWVVCKRSLISLRMNIKYYLLVSIGLPLCFAIGLTISKDFGFATLWCWISGPAQTLRFTLFYMFVVAAWLFNMLVYILVRRSHAKGGGATSTALQAQSAVQKKMAQYITIFGVVWFFGLLNRTIQDLAYTTQFWALTLHVLFVPLQGFLNAIVYGGLFETKAYKDLKSRIKSLCCKSNPSCLNSNSNNAPLLADARPASYSMQARRRATPWRPLPASSKKSLSLFVSTYNLAEREIADLTDLQHWLPPDPSVHDVYAIGVQECMCLPALRSALHAQLGGPERFTMFVAEIGSTNTALGFHGMIAVTVFARTEDVKSGAFQMVAAQSSEIKKGADLFVTTAPNKGAVGLPFIYHDTSLAFFTGHFAANSKGRNRLTARLSDSRDTLSKAVLTEDDIGFDTHLCHNHVFVFGDLNYRCTSSPTMVLELVTSAAKLERDTIWGGAKNHRELAYRGTHQRQPFRAKQLPDSVETAWNKIVSLDELQLVMGEGEVFFDFNEPGGTPKFPPSFRRKMGAAGECGDYTDLAMLEGAYTTIVKEKLKGGSGKDAVKDDGQDGKDGADEDAWEEEGARSLDARATGATATQMSMSVVLKPGERIPSYTDRVLYHTLVDSRGAINGGVYEVCDQVVQSDHRPVTATFGLLVDERVIRGKAEGEEALVKLSMSDMVLSGGLGAEGVNASEVVMVFPIPTEDPLVEERRVQAVASALFTGDMNEGDAVFSTGDGGSSVVVNKRDIMKSEARVAWGKECEMVSECRPDIGCHALVKVCDSSGASLGQGVVGLGAFMERVLAGAECREEVAVEMSMGGKLVGELKGLVKLVELWEVEAGGGANIV